MWNPGFPFADKRRAKVFGYHRSFCVLSDHYRGTADKPGLVLGLDRGGSCQGMAFRLAPATALTALNYLWDREMVTDVYEPRIIRVQMNDCDVFARTFVVNTAHRHYMGRLPDDEILSYISQGVGVSGRNVDYLVNTASHLQSLGIKDRALRRISRQI